jgi:1-deoxyxylulose-5-phosphate synthase
MSGMNRRDFLKGGVAAVALGGLPGVASAKRTAGDWVALGKSGVKVTRLAFGTGSFGGSVQRALGQEQFTRLVRHAHERGIRFFETADSYTGMPQMLATALQGVPRDSYKLMTKCRVRESDDPQATIDRLRKDLKADQIDILLMHCVRSPRWPEELKRLQDAFSEAKAKKIILAHGASVHGLLPLRAFPANKWVDVALLRINHNGTRMDTLQMKDTDELGNVDEVVSHAKQIHAGGAGVLGMKLIGEGRFKTEPERYNSLKFAMGTGAVDAVTIGFKNTAEIDEAIERMSRVLNS